MLIYVVQIVLLIQHFDKEVWNESTIHKSTKNISRTNISQYRVSLFLYIILLNRNTLSSRLLEPPITRTFINSNCFYIPLESNTFSEEECNNFEITKDYKDYSLTQTPNNSSICYIQPYFHLPFSSNNSNFFWVKEKLQRYLISIYIFLSSSQVFFP